MPDKKEYIKRSIRKGKKAKYQATYMNGRKMVSFVLDKEEDKDLIEWLERQENQSEAIREALREVRL